MNRIKITAIAILAVSLFAGACSSSGAGTSTTVVAGDDGSGVVFGRGSVPATVPDSFPIPDQAVVGATLIDTNRGVTEMVLNLPASSDATITYYQKNLPASGYEITSSGGSEIEWEIVFVGGDVDGVVGVKVAGNGLSSVAVRLALP